MPALYGAAYSAHRDSQRCIIMHRIRRTEINWSRAAIVARAHFSLFFSIIIMNVFEIGVYVCVRAELMLHYDQQHLIAVAGSRPDVNYTNTLSHSLDAHCVCM